MNNAVAAFPQKQNISFYFLLTILCCASILFGSIHPLVQSVLVALILLSAAVMAWQRGFVSSMLSTPGVLVVIGLFLYVFLQTIPLPLSWLKHLDPARYAWAEAVSLLAHTPENFAPLSYLGVNTLFELFLYISLVPLFFMVRSLFLGKNGRFRYRMVSYVLIGVGLVQAIYGIFQFIHPNVGILWLHNPTRAAHGSIIYANHYGALLNLCWPQAWALALHSLAKNQQHGGAVPAPRRHEPWRRTVLRLLHQLSLPREASIFFFMALLMMVAVLCSLSRGAILALVVILLGLNIVLPLSRQKGQIIFGFFCTFLLLFTFFLDFNIIWQRFATFEDSGLARFQLYAASLPILADHWLTGIGLGAYTAVSPLYLKNFPAHLHFDHAHNEFLELAIELGLPAACLLFGLIAVYFLKHTPYLLSMRKQPYHVSSRVILGISAWCTLLGFFLHGAVDFGWRLPVNLLFVTILAVQLSLLKVYAPAVQSGT